MAALYPLMPNKCQEFLSALSVTEFNADTFSELNGLTTGVQTKMGAPLFPKMKKLPPDIQVARDKALGIERKPETPAAPKAKKNQTKSVPSRSISEWYHHLCENRRHTNVNSRCRK